MAIALPPATRLRINFLFALNVPLHGLDVICFKSVQILMDLQYFQPQPTCMIRLGVNTELYWRKYSWLLPWESQAVVNLLLNQPPSHTMSL